MKASTTFLWAGVAAPCLALGLASPASAQEAPSAPAVAKAQDGAADSVPAGSEIIVTAQRREERLIDVPVSVAAFSGEDLSKAQITSLQDLQTRSPNLIIAKSTDRGTAFFFMRGVGTQIQDRGFEQAVGVYIDGVYRGRAGAALMDLQDLSRVEVLRGPQSTLFGRNNLVGAVNISTSAPSFDFGGSSELTYGNFNALQAKVSVTGPLSDRIAVRLSAQHVEREGILNNISPLGRDLEAVNSWAVKGQVLINLSDRGTLRLIGDYSHARDRCCGVALAFVSDASAAGNQRGYTPPGPGVHGIFTRNGTPGTFYDPRRRTVSDDGIHFQTLEDYGISAELNQEIGATNLTVIGSYRNYKSHQVTDISYSDNVALRIPVTVLNDFPERSLEVRVSNARPGPLEWVLGAYYFSQKLREDDSFLAVGVHYVTNQKTNSSAIFGQATYHVTDELSLTGGLRYLRERRSEISVGIPPATTLGTLGTVHQNDNALMGTAVVAYQPSRNANIYAKYSRGFLAGAINLFISSPAIQAQPSVKPSTNDAFEIGGKFRLLDGKLDVNAAVFHQTIKNQQVQSILPGTFSFVALNAAEVESKGIELDISARPVEGLTISSSSALIDSKYSSFPNAPVPTGSPAGVVVQDLTGRPANRAPKFTTVAQVQYDAPLGSDLTLTPRLSGRYSSGYFTDLTNDPLFRQSSTFMVDASLELAATDDWSVQIWGKNLTDEDVIRRGQYIPGSAPNYGFYYQDPRTYGITGRFSF